MEKDIALEFEAMAGKIEGLVGRQTIRRQTEIKNYQGVLNSLEDLVYSFDGVVQFPQRFLLCYKQFHLQLKQLETMTINMHGGEEERGERGEEEERGERGEEEERGPGNSKGEWMLKTVDLKAITSSWKVAPL